MSVILFETRVSVFNWDYGRARLFPSSFRTLGGILHVYMFSIESESASASYYRLSAHSLELSPDLTSFSDSIWLGVYFRSYAFKVDKMTYLASTY